MLKKSLFVFFFAVLLVMTSFAVNAAELASDISVKVDNTGISGNRVGVIAGKTIHVEVAFKAIVDDEDVEVKVWIDGFKEDIEAETDRFDVYTNGTYSSDSITPLYLAIPNDLDVKEDSKLIVRIASKNDESQENYQLTVQRPSYELEIISAGFVHEIESGEALQIDVVVKNRGGHKIEDTFVKAKIPELALVSREFYAGDLVPTDSDDSDKEDAVEKTVVINIPDGTKSGTYELEITAYNDDAETILTDSITIKGIETTKAGVEVVTTQLSKEVTIGGQEVYRIEIFNPTDEAKTITITTPAALEAKGIKVTATPSVITVPADSSQVVEVQVEAGNQTNVGSYSVPLSISSDEKTIKEVGITANVVKFKAKTTAKPILTLSVVLGIIFVVLLIVLFTTVRKPKEMGEEETAYY